MFLLFLFANKCHGGRDFQNQGTNAKMLTEDLHSRCVFAYLLLIETFVYLARQPWSRKYCEAVGGKRSDSDQFDKCFALGIIGPTKTYKNWANSLKYRF